jgi:hypothetical protein
VRGRDQAPAGGQLVLLVLDVIELPRIELRLEDDASAPYRGPPATATTAQPHADNFDLLTCLGENPRFGAGGNSEGIDACFIVREAEGAAA